MFATPLADCVTSVTSANLQKLRWFVSCDTGDADDAESWRVLRNDRPMIGLIEAARRLNQILYPGTGWQRWRLAGLVRTGILDRLTVVDELADIADGQALTFAHGDDRITSIIAEAFAGGRIQHAVRKRGGRMSKPTSPVVRS